jgi:hypothetical protein
VFHLNRQVGMKCVTGVENVGYLYEKGLSRKQLEPIRRRVTGSSGVPRNFFSGGGGILVLRLRSYHPVCT